MNILVIGNFSWLENLDRKHTSFFHHEDSISCNNLYLEIQKNIPDLIILRTQNFEDSNYLECINIFRTSYPQTKFLLISSEKNYDELYAAMKANIEFFFVEPIDLNEINKVISELRNTDINEQENNFAQTHKQAVRDLFFSKTIFELDSNHNLDSINETYWTHFDEGLFRVFDIKIDFENRTSKEIELKDFQIKLQNSVGEVFQEYCFDILYQNRFTGIMVLLNYSETADSKIIEKFNDLYTLINKNHLIGTDNVLTLSAGGAYRHIYDILQSQKEALHKSWSRIIEGSGKVLIWESEKELSTDDLELFNVIRRQAMIACETLNLDMFKETMESYFKLKPEILNKNEVHSFTREMKDYLFETNSKRIKEIGDIDEIYIGTRKALNASSTLDEYKDTYITQCSWIFTNILQSPESKHLVSIRDAISFIKQHYSEDIGANDVAEHVGLTSTYFSFLFKKETGENFISYLLNYRLNVAKNLLQESELSIKEISEVTGFNDQRYFSKKFKLVIGLTPTLYRAYYN